MTPHVTPPVDAATAAVPAVPAVAVPVAPPAVQAPVVTAPDAAAETAAPAASPAEQPATPAAPSSASAHVPAKPGMPGRRPGPAAVVAAPATSPAAADILVAPSVIPVDPHQWGRIEADGAVFLKTQSGERKIADWQAGDAESGLAHFGRRFDDFSTEIALLEARLANGSGDAKTTKSQAVSLKESIDTLAALGDFNAAASRLDAVIKDADVAIGAASAARAAARASAVAAKEALCAESELLATSTQWKQSGDRLKAIVAEWRAIRGIDRKTDDTLWKRFSRARDSFTRARGSHFAELDKLRLAAQDEKEKLIKKAEALSTSREWRDTAVAYRDLMNEWKAAGRAPRDVEDKLWDRFRAAQEGFFARRNEVMAERDSEFEANAEAKQKLLVEVEQIDVTSGLEEAKRKLRSVQERWEAAGKVPREQMQDLDGRLRRVEDQVRQASEAEWKRSDPEALARVEQFRVKVDHFRAQATKARAAGNERKATEAEQQAATWEEWLKTAQNAVEG
ncbi:MAG: DUF349 domain-containing protein [Nakamurella sp.]